MGGIGSQGKASWLTYTLATLALASMAFVGVTFYRLMDNSAKERAWIASATSAQVYSQKLSMYASEAALGNLQVFKQLSDTYSQIRSDMDTLNNGSQSAGLPPLPRALGTRLRDLNETWGRIDKNALRIIQRESLVNDLAAASDTFMSIIPDIQANTDRVVRNLIESGATNQQVFAASRELVLADRMLRRIDVILKGGPAGAKAAEELRSEMALFEQVQSALANGNQRMGVTAVRNQQALNTLAQVRKQWQEARPQVETILGSTSDMFEVRDAADWIFLDSHEMFDRAATLTSAIAALPDSRVWPSRQYASIGLAILIVLVAVLVTVLVFAQRRRADVAFSHNRRTQKAILKLLDELSSLADGDLTVQAGVTDEVTGAIADAINYAVEQLRELVTGINVTAHSVADSAEHTRQATAHLAQAARGQADQVGQATAKIQAMAASFNAMADRSGEASETALESVNIAHTGAKKVRETITGMDHIREQIQETSKRIKRLGESIQEIGDIVSLINDIAEQTNVLALNAAIQAASGGGSGKGFAVVADEVQQLAESATHATKRISTLVETIQVDAAEAVASMETTTSEVVSGAALSQDAGQALLQIETVSNELSQLIQQIVSEARDQSANATRISELMEGIRQVSIKTSEGTVKTAGSVIELAELVQQLRASVADFKLPEAN